MSSRKIFEASVISAKDIQVGDRLDITGKTRVHRIMKRDNEILAGTKTRGSGTGGIASWHPDAEVRVYR